MYNKICERKNMLKSTWHFEIAQQTTKIKSSRECTRKKDVIILLHDYKRDSAPYISVYLSWAHCVLFVWQRKKHWLSASYWKTCKSFTWNDVWPLAEPCSVVLNHPASRKLTLTLVSLCSGVMTWSTGFVAATANPTETTVSCTETPASHTPRYMQSTEDAVRVSAHTHTHTPTVQLKLKRDLWRWSVCLYLQRIQQRRTWAPVSLQLIQIYITGAWLWTRSDILSPASVCCCVCVRSRVLPVWPWLAERESDPVGSGGGRIRRPDLQRVVN